MSKISILLSLALCCASSYGTSPPVYLPPVVCTPPQEKCGDRICYTPSDEQCLKFSDGSGGIRCPFGDTFCSGKCLSPTSGKVCVQGGYSGEGICNPGEALCGLGYCYSPDTHNCLGGAFICKKGKDICGSRCYTASDTDVCVVGPSGWGFVCKPDQSVCGGSGCYDPKEQQCDESQHQISSKVSNK